MENEGERKKAVAEAKKAKLENLERKIASASVDPESIAGKKHRLDDTEYLEQSQEIIDSVRSAVSTGWYTSPNKCGFITERTYVRLAQEEEKGQSQSFFQFSGWLKCPHGTTKKPSPCSPGSCSSRSLRRNYTCRSDCISIASPVFLLFYMLCL